MTTYVLKGSQGTPGFSIALNSGVVEASGAGLDGAVATAEADVGAVMSDGTFGLATILNSQTYTAGTMQLSGSVAASVTLTAATQNGLIALANTMGTDLVAAKVASSKQPADVAVVLAGGGNTIGNMSRSTACKILAGIMNWIRSDGINPAGASVPFGSP